MTRHNHTARNRSETPFTWYVSCGMPVYAELAGVPYDLTFYDSDAIMQAFDVGYPRALALYGSDVRYSPPGWSGISYGHVNCLGVPLTFPKGSEVAHTPIYDSLKQGVRALQRHIDWANAGLMPEYLELWQKIKQAYPENDIPFQGFGVEGPVTTAWELRGHSFFLDLYDDAALTKTYMESVTSSIVDYMIFQRKINGQQEFVDSALGMVDDISALLHPKHWMDFVVPYQEKYYCAQGTGQRHAHIEGLVPAHLQYLDILKLDSFDPSVSPTLCPRDITESCSVPFWWRLNSMQVRDYTPEQVRNFVYDAVADGASGVFCTIGRIMTTAASVKRVNIFIRAAKHVSELLQKGIPPRELRCCMLPISHYI